VPVVVEVQEQKSPKDPKLVCRTSSISMGRRRMLHLSRPRLPG